MNRHSVFQRNIRDAHLAALSRCLELHSDLSYSAFEWRQQCELPYLVYEQVRALRMGLQPHEREIDWSDEQSRAQKYYAFLDAHPEGLRLAVEGRLGYYDAILSAVATIIEAIPHQRILDLGCSAGLATLYLGRRFPESAVVGLDQFPGMIETAQKWQSLSATPNVVFRQQDYCDYQPHEQFDVVLSLQSLPAYMLPWLPSEAPNSYLRSKRLDAEIADGRSPVQAIVKGVRAIRSTVKSDGHVIFQERLLGLSRIQLFDAVLRSAGFHIREARMIDWQTAGQENRYQLSPLIVVSPQAGSPAINSLLSLDGFLTPSGHSNLAGLPTNAALTWEGMEAHANYDGLLGSRDEVVVRGSLNHSIQFEVRVGVSERQLAYAFHCDTADSRKLAVTHTRNMRSLCLTVITDLQTALQKGEILQITPPVEKLSYVLAKRFARY